MALMHYDPWTQLRRIQTDLDRFFGPGALQAGERGAESETAGNWLPAVDITENEQNYEIRADLPGVDPNNIEVSMDDHVLSIHGSRDSESTEEGTGWRRVERVQGTFHRRFSLPEDADPENIQARCRNGVLHLTVPKKEREPNKRIPVQVESE